MRSLFALLLLPAFAFAQTADEKKATVKFIGRCFNPDTGGFAVDPPAFEQKPKPSLRAANGAVNALKFFGGEVPEKALSKFVMSCYDEKTGAFAEPGEKPTVASTSVGVLAATALGVPRKSLKKAIAYLDKNATTFEDFRIAAAAVEAFGVESSRIDPGIDPSRWVLDALKDAIAADPNGKRSARDLASLIAMQLRLGQKVDASENGMLTTILDSQLKDGGWGKKGAKTSDAETTYRVMRALMLLKEKPKDVDGVAKFVASCRRKDGGYGVDADAPSSMSGVYYAAKVSEWLK